MSTVKVVPNPYRERLLQAKRERAIVESAKARALKEEIFTVQRHLEFLEKEKMSGDGKRSVAAWPKLPRPSSTLPKWECVSSLCGVCCGRDIARKNGAWYPTARKMIRSQNPLQILGSGYLTSG